MSIEVNIPQILQQFADGAPSAEAAGGTVGECLTAVITKYPRLREQIFEDNGKLRSFIDVYVNKKSSHPEGLSKKVADGDKLHIINIIAGG